MQSASQQWQAAFIPEEPDNYPKHLEHWQKITANPEVINKTILVDDKVAGHVGRWILGGVGQVTFWIGQNYEGNQVATEALTQFLELDSLRPLEGRCAFDNRASVKVLEKNGFVQVGTDVYFANARNEEITELVFQLL